MKFSKKKINKRNKHKKKTVKHKILKKNISRIKRISKKPKLTRKKKIGGAIDNKVMNKLFIQVTSDIQDNNIKDIISILDQTPQLINYQFGDNESSLLHQSCFYKKPEIIKLLIEKGADVNLISHDSTPLGFASFNTCFECIKILLANGANINGTDSMMKIPLMYALTKSTELFSKTNLNNNTKEDKNSYIDIIKYLINKGSDLNHRDIYGWTSIYYAIEYGATIQIIELLLRNGSDVRNLSNIGNSVLQIACKRRSLDVIKVLFDLNKITKLTINIPDNFGTTSLIEATNRNNFDIVDFLLNNGADPSLKDKSGKTALKYAFDKASRIDNDLKQAIDDKDLTYLTKSKENNTKIIKLLEEKRQEQIKQTLAKLGKPNDIKQNEKQSEINKLKEQEEQIKKHIADNEENFNKVKELNADIIAQQLIEEEEANKRLAEAKKTKNKNKKNKAREKKASEIKTVDDLPINTIVEPFINTTVEPPLTTSVENSKSIENSEQSELHLAYLNSLNEEAEQRLKLDTQKAIELSNETALLEFWSVYFDNKKENIFKLKENITTLMEGQNAYNLLKSIIPAYSNKYIQRIPNINNILSLLFILIGIISYQINQKNNLVYLLLKGGAAIQTVSSQLPNISYESNDLDIVIINNKNYNAVKEENEIVAEMVAENKMFAEKIGELLIWLTNSILSMEPNKDEKYKIYKINLNQTSLIDLDYNVLPSNISKLYTQDNYIKNYNIEPYGIFNGIFRCPSLINLIKEKMYYLIIYGSVSGIKEGKNRSFFLNKIPKSLNYLINVYRVMGNFNESDQDFYKRIFTYFFRDYPKLKDKLRDPNDPDLKIDGTLVPYTEPLLIQFLIDKLD